MEGGEAGGGRRRPAQRRSGELHRQPWEVEQGRQGNRGGSEEEEGEEKSEGLIWKKKRSRDFPVK
jgi:hypothetical protein